MAGWWCRPGRRLGQLQAVAVLLLASLSSAHSARHAASRAAFGFAGAAPAAASGSSMLASTPPTRMRTTDALPSFPDSPDELFGDMAGSLLNMLREGSSRRLRIDLQLTDLAAVSPEWARGLGSSYFNVYEELLVRLHRGGYEKVLAIFNTAAEATAMESRLRRCGLLEAGSLQIDYLTNRGDWISVGYKDLVVFFAPRAEGDNLSNLSSLTEFQRVAAVSTIRGCPVVTINPRMWASSTLPHGLNLVRPMILSDFAPCFQLSTHRYKFEHRLAYSLLRREGRDWEVFVHDGRLPGSGWAYMESHASEPSRSDIETRYLDPVECHSELFIANHMS